VFEVLKGESKMKAKPAMFLWSIRNGWREELIKLTVTRETSLYYWLDGPIPKKVDKRSPHALQHLFRTKQEALREMKKRERARAKREVIRLRHVIARYNKDLRRAQRELAKLQRELSKHKGV
jgi:hypothetical protein